MDAFAPSRAGASGSRTGMSPGSAAAPAAAQLSLTPKAPSETPSKRVKTVLATPGGESLAQSQHLSSTRLRKPLDDKISREKIGDTAAAGRDQIQMLLTRGAYQRTDYVVARGSDQTCDRAIRPYAMTLLGEMYANGRGVAGRCR